MKSKAWYLMMKIGSLSRTCYIPDFQWACVSVSSLRWIARKLQASKKQIAKRPAIAGRLTSLLFGAHGRSRTSDRLVRSQVLYPAELHALNPELRKLGSQSIVKNGGEGGIRTLDGR